MKKTGNVKKDNSRPEKGRKKKMWTIRRKETDNKKYEKKKC